MFLFCSNIELAVFMFIVYLNNYVYLNK